MRNWNQDKLTIGVCYYPEHWPKSMWQEDLDRMWNMGIRFVRIAEFAWTIMEPEEGTFDFSLFDEFIELCEKKKMPVILCTPTPTPPVWLTHKYPETLNCDILGDSYYPGHRRHHNMNTDIYYELSARIVTKMAEHYKDSKMVIGWQLDNEFNCSIAAYYSDADNRAFIAYCKEKFSTLDNFNEAMGNVFWSQTYTNWDQVHMPRKVARDSFNPHMVLEHKKFISHTIIRYAKMQSDILRSIVPSHHFVTTNGLFRNIDNIEMTKQALDFITFDSYPNFAYDMYPETKSPRTLNDRDWIKNLSKTRAISPNFGIMEQQSGANGWNTGTESPMPKPGQLRLWTYQSIAHGADFVCYFRWRTSPCGTEIYWEGLNSHSNKTTKRIKEAQGVCDELKILDDVAGSEYVAKIGYLSDFYNEYDTDIDVIHNRYHKESEASWFIASTLSHTPIDYVYLHEDITAKDLLKYEMLVYPHACILTKDMADILKVYVLMGGILVIGARTGFKDEYGKCPMTSVPGFLSDLVGVQSGDHTLIGPYDEAVTATWDDLSIDMLTFMEALEITDEGVLVHARFDNGVYESMPAVTQKTAGKGSVFMVAGAFSEQMVIKIMEQTRTLEPYRDILSLPTQCEIAIRKKGNTEYVFILNYSDKKADIVLHKPCTDLLNNKTVKDTVTMDEYGVLILKLKE